jgi:hypothetical protein
MKPSGGFCVGETPYATGFLPFVTLIPSFLGWGIVNLREVYQSRLLKQVKILSYFINHLCGAAFWPSTSFFSTTSINHHHKEKR